MTELVEVAQDLSGQHVGLEALLPGRHDGSGWMDTWAAITMIQHKRDGSVKVRRHPDSHVDHVLAAGDEIHLRTPPGVSTDHDEAP